MKTNTVQRIIGAFVLLISSIQMIITTQVSVSFWDPGELSAAAYRMQVPHPPGGPLFSLVGRIFYMLPIPGSLGFRMNLVSALASAFTVLFLYLIIIKVIEAYKGKPEHVSFDALATCIIAAIGALTLSFSDTFWFNAAEANYFASSTFLYSSMLLLMLIWNEHADEPGSERYLLLIAPYERPHYRYCGCLGRFA
jgi:cation transport ATPase